MVDGEEEEEEALSSPPPVYPQRDLVPLRFQTPKRKSLSELHLKSFKEKCLFHQSINCCCAPQADPSIMITGFGLRNVDSVQRAIHAHELEKQASMPETVDEIEEEKTSKSTSQTTSFKSETETTQTESPAVSIMSVDKKLEYLLGIETPLAEEHAPFIAPEIQEEMSIYIKDGAEGMRLAQRYLRTHKIFQFFKFLISLLLSEMPENPIDFLLQLLDKLLLYRSGISNPVVLFEKKHIEALFNLMDRMRTGSIDLQQYNIGMQTLGICIYNKNPPMSEDCTVPKEFFINEAYECQIDILNDLIYVHDKSHKDYKPPLMLKTPPPSLQGQSYTDFGVPTVVNPSFYHFLIKTKPQEVESLGTQG
ncbi:uncharacterized protein LOC109606350 isoform X2 [Aethina tumida]|nr:uncharacterized protein LOC109606350 isoform X2 [Aethina tumida]